MEHSRDHQESEELADLTDRASRRVNNAQLLNALPDLDVDSAAIVNALSSFRR